MPNVPCSTCPWRKSSTVGGEDIPNFDIALMRDLAKTVPTQQDYRNGRRDAFRTIMACHYAACGAETPCIGYVAVEGNTNLALRVMAAKGRLDFMAIYEACEQLDLWESFAAMLQAYEATRET